MDAVAKALQAAGVPSVGLCLTLEALADGSGRIDVRLDFDDFGPRLAIFKRYSIGVFMLPGGVGTFHEASDFMDNIAKLKMPNVPVYFVEFDDDHPFWPGILHGFTEGAMKQFGTVGQKETSLMNIVHARDLYARLVGRWERVAEKEERALAALR
jgi:predicted Rossmann-fold nucleotide-binding protein